MTVPKVWRTIPQYYNLIGNICRRCDKKYFPPRDICPECGEHPLDRFKFSGHGTIVTYTVVRTAISDPEGEINDKHFLEMPYILAIIRLDEGASLTAQIVDCSLEEVEIGCEVENVFRKIMAKGDQGVIQYGYKFRLR